jgi:AraC-like DNA-binding protein
LYFGSFLSGSKLFRKNDAKKAQGGWLHTPVFYLFHIFLFYQGIPIPVFNSCPLQIWIYHNRVRQNHWCRIQEAKRLLNETDLNVTEIAFRLGFNSHSYFSAIFKDQEGLTPSEYRGKYGMRL